MLLLEFIILIKILKCNILIFFKFQYPQKKWISDFLTIQRTHKSHHYLANAFL